LEHLITRKRVPGACLGFRYSTLGFASREGESVL
jgi:hypothetical protein